MDIKLTNDQQKAYETFIGFLASPTDQFMILSGYAGTGKTTLINHLVENYNRTIKAVRTLGVPLENPWDILITATTNKAAQVLSQKTNITVKTIHSTLGLRMERDYSTGLQKLVRRSKHAHLENKLILIDESSFIDPALMVHLRESINPDCKVLFIGDPAQLAPVKATKMVMSELTGVRAELKEIVRQQEAQPIIALAHKFRDTVVTKRFFNFTPDGHYIQYMETDAFEKAVLKEFSNPAWKHDDSKILAWTNQRVIDYNHAIRDNLQGQPILGAGDYAISNEFFTCPETGRRIRTDQQVRIQKITPETDLGIAGYHVHLDCGVEGFMPENLLNKKRLIKQALKEGNVGITEHIDSCWIDLRAQYACTVNKSQGSTYNRVFIDLDDIARCKQPTTLARMLYVAVSRAREQVIFTGDII